MIFRIFAVMIASLIFCCCTPSKTATATISLDGSKSYDPDGYIATWGWRQLAGPALVIKNKTSKKTEAPVKQEAIYSFELTVTDNQQARDKDTVIILYKKQSPRFF